MRKEEGKYFLKVLHTQDANISVTAAAQFCAYKKKKKKKKKIKIREYWQIIKLPISNFASCVSHLFHFGQNTEQRFKVFIWY